MNRIRLASAVLICVALSTVAACGEEETPTGSAPSASTAPSSATTSPAPPPPSAAGGATDKEICESVKKLGEDSKASMIAAVQSGGEPSPVVFKKLFTDMEQKVAALATTGGDSEVTSALKQLAAEAAKAAAAADPAAAADTPAFQKAGTDLTAACKPTGVNVNF